MSIYEVKQALDHAIKSAAEQAIQGQPSRNRKLSVADTVRLLIEAEGGSLNKILHDAGIEVTASAVSQRRAQIEPSVFRAVFDSFNAACEDTETFRGYRLVAADGTVLSLPRNPGAPSFVCHDGIPGGINQLHVTPLYSLQSRTFSDLVIQPEPKKDEIGALITMLKRNTFDQKTLIIADRGFEGYNMLAHLLEKPNVDFLIRVKQSRSAMREVAKLPLLEIDCDISFSICTSQKNTDKQNPNYVFLQVPKKSKPGSKTRRGRWDFGNYYPMRFRICHFLLDNGEFETVATSLPRSFTPEDIKALYHMRWGQELAFRDWKLSVGLAYLHGRSDAFAEQEIYASLTAFNFASRVCREVVVRQPSFTDVSAGADYAPAVAWAVEQKITSGTGGGNFSPAATCTRGQIVTFLHRAMGK